MLDDLRALRVYMAVVDTGSLTDAARRLSIAPSTVSKHLSALESNVSSQLIIRSTKQLHVTEVGRRGSQQLAINSREKFTDLKSYLN